jgi:hypothetical protein
MTLVWTPTAITMATFTTTIGNTISKGKNVTGSITNTTQFLRTQQLVGFWGTQQPQGFSKIGTI